MQGHRNRNDQERMADGQERVKEDSVAEIGVAALLRPCIGTEISPCRKPHHKAIDIDSRQRAGKEARDKG
jgi:hypothetical protein